MSSSVSNALWGAFTSLFNKEEMTDNFIFFSNFVSFFSLVGVMMDFVMHVNLEIWNLLI
jgi:hypothetical protein